ncbi:MAG TPA: Uma2 family endonuclease [Panacibacter sp.]|nr:Uma2 family endonuclease [Panacibacter sp.]
MIQQADISKKYTLDEYIKIDETGTQRHEYYYGKLIPMPGESLMHNEICLRLFLLLHRAFLSSSFKIYVENVKVNIEGESIYLYPDITVMKEQPKADLPRKEYIIYQPLLIAEVLSDSTRKYDLTDKLIQYQKISTLQYYLAVEPEKFVVIFYEKEENGNWNAKTYTELNEVINLPLLNANITLGDIYKP